MLIKTNDGSFTLKSKKFNECYHSREGALTESLYKHVLPAFEVIKKEEIKHKELNKVILNPSNDYVINKFCGLIILRRKNEGSSYF